MNTSQIQQTLRAFDQNPDNPYRTSIMSSIERSVDSNQPIQLLLFTCSTIQADKLFSDTSWEYVSLDPAGNNLEPDLPRLRQIVMQLKNIYPTEVRILIGNTDPYYIYLQQFALLPEERREFILKKFAQRWSIYRNRFEKFIYTALPTNTIQVVSWYELEKQMEEEWSASFEQEFNTIYKNIRRYFAREDFEWEFRQLVTQFSPGKYFSMMNKPPDNILWDWILRKFSEYALQGAWLARKFPNAILIQNEKPSDLRSKMYQPVLQERENRLLPIIYPLGIDNQGYI